MDAHILPIAKLINCFRRLPGVGQKAAARYAYALVDMDETEVREFAAILLEAKEKTHHCSVCGNWSEGDVCEICATRDHATICVVAEPKDILSIERMHDYKGVYHVLGGTLLPSAGIGEEELRIKELVGRVKADGVREVIVATNPDFKGDATAHYIAHELRPLGVKVTRLAQGVAIGSDIEYADEMTLQRAFKNRSEL